MPERLKASVAHRLADGRTKYFSIREDFEAALPGLRNDSGFDEATVAEAMFAWARTGQTGCLFAALLAAGPTAAGWRSLVIPDAVSDDTLHALVDAMLATEPEAVTIVFPWVDTAAALAALVSQVARLPDWQSVLIDGDELPGLIRVGLRWRLPVEDHASWVLGFGPFEFLPFTRRAPFTALVFRCRAAYSLPRRRAEDHNEVHLADLPAPVDEVHYERMWRRTVERKVNLLAGQLEAGAKARVTFTLPAELRDQLGLAS